jgi:hypothetical protein
MIQLYHICQDSKFTVRVSCHKAQKALIINQNKSSTGMLQTETYLSSVRPDTGFLQVTSCLTNTQFSNHILVTLTAWLKM